MDVFEKILEMSAAHPGPFFMGTPDEWYEPCHWWCEDGHRSKWYIKSERLGYFACPAGGCMKPVGLGPKDIPGIEPK